jgi:hypothetical protein
MEDNDSNYKNKEAPLSPMCLSHVVKDIMGKVVAKKSSINYVHQNLAFALYRHKSDKLRSTLFEPWFVWWLQEPFATATARKKYVQECLLAMSPEDDNCPFILLNLSFAHFSNFLSTRTRSRGKRKGEPNLLLVASYDQAKSALVHLFRMSKYDMPMEFAEKLKIFMKGMKRHVATKNMEGGDCQIVGKKKMDYKVYEKLCELFFERGRGGLSIWALFSDVGVELDGAI